MYFGARYYDPWVGRFMSQDPDLVGAFGGVTFGRIGSDPQEFNAYSYVTNRPTTMVDPTGRFSGCARLGAGCGVQTAIGVRGGTESSITVASTPLDPANEPDTSESDPNSDGSAGRALTGNSEPERALVVQFVGGEDLGDTQEPTPSPDSNDETGGSNPNQSGNNPYTALANELVEALSHGDVFHGMHSLLSLVGVSGPFIFGGMTIVVGIIVIPECPLCGGVAIGVGVQEIGLGLLVLHQSGRPEN